MRAFAKAILLFLLTSTFLSQAFAQSAQEIPIERCDRLPVVFVKADGKQMRFLVDTGATSALNIKSFPGGNIRQIEITSWQGKNFTPAREVEVPEISLGSYRLQGLRLPAMDLTVISTACGKRIDGVIGVDLLEMMGATIDLRRHIATLPGGEQKPIKTGLLDEVMRSHDDCVAAFNHADIKKFGNCMDENMVWFTPFGEFHSRKEVLDYFQEHFFATTPPAQIRFDIHDFHLLGGDAYWCTYEYTMKMAMPEESYTARGMAMSRKIGNRWQMVSAHNSMVR
jgi:ketosteroid isomerase-like protein/predicted aspartyl protease